MKGALRIFKCPLVPQQVQTEEGFDRLIAHIPDNAKVLYLGAEPPTEAIFIYVQAPDKYDKEGNPRQWTLEELKPIEFILVIPGHLVPVQYEYRASLRIPDKGIAFLFVKKVVGLIVTPGGRG